MGDHRLKGQLSVHQQLDGPLIVHLLIHQGANNAQLAVLYQSQIHSGLFAKHTHDHNGRALACILNCLGDRVLDADAFQDQVSPLRPEIPQDGLLQVLFQRVDREIQLLQKSTPHSLAFCNL